MPLFFFISGYLCKPQKVALKKINQKCGHILVPYVITTFFTIILSLIFESGIVLVKDHKTVFLPNMMKWLEAGVLGLGYRADYRGGVLPSIGPVWFLLALFWATLLLEAYKRLHCSPIITSIIVGVCSIVSFRYFFLPWSIQEGMVASVFMTLGYIYRPKENRIKNQKALRIVVLNFYIYCMRRVPLMFRDAMGLFWHDRYKSLAEAAVNLVVSIVLAKKIGILGVLIGTTISSLSTCVWIEPLILYKYGFKSSVVEYFKDNVVYLGSVIGVILLVDIINQFIYFDGFIGVIVKGIISALCYIAVIFIVYGRSKEFSALKKYALSLLKKNK